jgi:6-phosphogluconolactonase (cycloisomerase 2 family)
MGNKTRSVLSLILLAGAALACGPVYGQHGDDRDNDRSPAVFVMTNAADRNEVISYKRNADGTLTEERHFSTGGRGSGGNNDPLESQGSLTLTQGHSHLLVVNAGSGDISLFRIHGSDLDLRDRVSSGGSEPNAIAQHGDLVYVLNTGGSSSVAGFRLHNDELTPIEKSLRFLSTNTSGAASLALSPNGQFLAVTERLTNSIDVFLVQNDGTLSPIVVNPSVGPGVFSLSFAPNGTAIVSETGAAGVPNGSAASSYAVQSNGTLSAITVSAPTLGAANCWNAVTPDGRFAYFSNAGSSTIAGFAIAANGILTALPGTVVGQNPAGATNLDIAASGDGKFLYTLNAKVGTIGIFSIQNDGTLAPVGSAGGITPNSGFNGIAAE